MVSDEIFEKFTRRWATDFRKLARMTQGEKDVGDLISDAWLLSFEIAAKRAAPFDFSNPQDQHLLMRWLNFEVNKKADLAFRFAQRPDADTDGLGLWDVLEADATDDPFERLASDQATAFIDEVCESSYSEYAAYCVGWQNSNQEMGCFAKYLAITRGALIQRFRRSNSIKEYQPSLFDYIEQIPEDFLPMPRRANLRAPTSTADRERHKSATLTQLI